MPGFIEAHGHPLMEAVALSDRIVDIRPVTIANPDDVVAAIHREVAKRGAAGAYLNGWDALLQPGLPKPTLAWLDDVAPDGPLVIIHNSGHKAYFNSRAAQLNGLTRDTPDPKGAKYGRDANGELDGTAEEIAAVFPLLGRRHPGRRLSGDAARRVRPAQPGRADHLFGDGVRPEFPAAGRAAARQADGAAAHLRGVQSADVHHRHARARATICCARSASRSGWTARRGSATSRCRFPYLDTEATRTIGVTPGSCGCANYTKEQLTEIVAAYYPLGWQMACHVQGDAGVDTILDVYEEALRRNPRDDHRLRLEHVGAIRDEQLQRAADSASPAASSSTRSTTGATSSSTDCSGRSADPVGCQRDPRWPPGCASRCTTIRRSPPRSRCATSAWP